MIYNNLNKSISKLNYNNKILNFLNYKNDKRFMGIMKKRYGFEDPLKHQIDLIKQQEEQLRKDREQPIKHKRVIKSYNITPPSIYNMDSVFQPPPERKDSKKLNIAVIGAPNAGKSTMVNAIVGEKICAVSSVEHTTRDTILGVLTEGDTQLLFHDTPGMIKNFNKNTNVREFVNLAWGVAKEADIVLMVVDATNNNEPDTKYIINQLEDQMIQLIKEIKMEDIESGDMDDKEFILVINKVDLIRRKEHLVELISELNEGNIFSDTFVISATNNVKLDALKQYLISKAKPGQWEYDETTRTDQTDIFRASEIIKEKLYSKLKNEIPYQVVQSTFGWTHFHNGDLRIDHDFIVTKSKHKSLILGKNGSVIKSIYLEARKDLEKIFNKKVHLFLNVKERSSTDHYELMD